jgi:hypothetical protein
MSEWVNECTYKSIDGVYECMFCVVLLHIPHAHAELEVDGHIHMRRFRPTEYEVKAYPLSCYPMKHPHAGCIALMLMNNLGRSVCVRV